MKCVVCTGTTGSERRQFLEELRKFKATMGKLVILDPWLRTKELHQDVDEATILNVSEEDRFNYFRPAYKTIANELEELRKKNIDVVTAVPMHSAFYWKSVFVDAVKDEYINWMSPDLFVTVIHNVRDVKANMEKDIHLRYPDITLSDIMHWRRREIQDTGRWAARFGKQHVVIARNEPVESLYGVLFTRKKRVYFSYPMSHVTEEEMARAAALINRLRELGYVVFDPGTIDDAKYMSQLHKQTTKEGNGSLPSQEMIRVANMVGEHTVDLDYRLVEQSDLVVVRYPSVKYEKYFTEKDSLVPGVYVPLSAGVICEMVKGYQKGKKVYAVWLPQTEPSPFFKYHCREVFHTEKDLLDYLVQKEPPG